jgi:hypothetical protein
VVARGDAPKVEQSPLCRDNAPRCGRRHCHPAGIDEGLLSADIDIEWVRQLLVSPIMAAALTLRNRVTYAQLALTVDTVLRGLSPRAE